jgi:UDP-N-acetyl-alpha-D-quinovosamine dehydrogenase
VNGRTGTSAVTGAGGFLGEGLLEKLAPGGEVRALFRREDERSASWAARGCHIVRGDLQNRPTLEELVRGAEIVYHCAATMVKSDAELSRRVNVLGTESVARAALAAGVKRFVYVSSISVYSATRRPGNVLTEEIEPENTGLLNNYARTKYEGEMAVRCLGDGQGLSYTIIRPTNIYGVRSGPWFRQWARTLRRLPFAVGDVLIDAVYVDDVVDALIAAGRSPAATNQTFNVGHEMVKMNRLIAEIGRVTGRRVRLLPAGVDRVLRLVVDRLYRGATGAYLSPCLTRPVYYPHGKASWAFGYTPQVKLAEGFARIAELYRATSQQK